LSYSSLLFDGYLSEINFVDGQALDPSAFGQTDPATGIWVPKKYTGTYGTNGFYLPFNDATSLTTLGYDRSGNGNNWTCNGISITAGATYDVMKDSPTNGAGEVGNYATLNPLSKSSVTNISGGNLAFSHNYSGQISQPTTISVSSGKWYFESTILNVGTTYPAIGIATSDYQAKLSYLGSDAISWGYFANGQKCFNGSLAAYGASWTTNDIIGCALDLDAGTVAFYKNGTSQGVAYSGLVGSFMFAISGISSQDVVDVVINVNFGQRPFAYTPPTGFKPLHTGNLPQATIKKPQEHFDVKLDTGANIKTTCEAVFTNELEWIKDRANANNHQLIDSVRGSNAVLQSNTTAAETTYTAPSGSSVGWVWRASDAAPVTNTDGSITSTVSANPTAGFSVVTYTGNNTNNATVGHGLGIAPRLVVVKRRGGAYQWPAYHASLTSGYGLWLNLANAQSQLSSSSYGGIGSASSSTLTLVTGASDMRDTNGLTTYVAYCFSEISGYSKFGSYVGNGSADGPFVFTGFTPKYVLIKCVSAAGNWYIFDTVRNTYNVLGEQLYSNLTNLASTVVTMDALSNGFKLRLTGDPNLTQTYIYMALAESPFTSNNRAR